MLAQLLTSTFIMAGALVVAGLCRLASAAIGVWADVALLRVMFRDATLVQRRALAVALAGTGLLSTPTRWWLRRTGLLPTAQ